MNDCLDAILVEIGNGNTSSFDELFSVLNTPVYALTVCFHTIPAMVADYILLIIRVEIN